MKSYRVFEPNKVFINVTSMTPRRSKCVCVFVIILPYGALGVPFPSMTTHVWGLLIFVGFLLRCALTLEVETNLW